MPISKPHKLPEPLYAALYFSEFPAQSLMAYDAKLRDLPFVVLNQNADKHKTVIIAVSPKAKQLNIVAGMPFYKVQKRFQQMQALLRNKEHEKKICAALQNLFYSYTPEFMIKDSGQSILHLTGTPMQRDYESLLLAEKLQRDIQEKIHLHSIAVGMGSSRLLAQVMTNLIRPEGIKISPREREAIILDPLSPQILPGLSAICRKKMDRYALQSIGQLRLLGREALRLRFGVEGEKLYSLVQGIDLQAAHSERKTLQAITVLENDINDENILAQKIGLTVDQLIFMMHIANVLTDRLTLTLRYADNKSVQKTISLPHKSNLFYLLNKLAQQCFFELYQRRIALRSMAISIPHARQDTGQIDLWESCEDKKKKAIGEALMKIRSKNNFTTITSAAHLEKSIRG